MWASWAVPAHSLCHLLRRRVSGVGPTPRLPDFGHLNHSPLSPTGAPAQHVGVWFPRSAAQAEAPEAPRLDLLDRMSTDVYIAGSVHDDEVDGRRNRGRKPAAARPGARAYTSPGVLELMSAARSPAVSGTPPAPPDGARRRRAWRLAESVPSKRTHLPPPTWRPVTPRSAASAALVAPSGLESRIAPAR